MNIIQKTGLLFTTVLVSGLLIHAVSTETKNKITNQISSQYFPSSIDFAGENVPLSIADVKERLDRELLVNANLHSSTLLILKRANRVFPIIEPILKENGVPDDFKYLAVIESNLTNAVSPAGARGVWQFMPATGKEFGMEISETVDERYHLEKATQAACKYLIEAKNKFGNWTLAAAAYNGGSAGVNKQIDNQQVNSYYDLLLNEETSRYVFRILALKEIMKNPDKFAFNIVPEDLYKSIPTKKIAVTSSIDNLAQFAKDQGINYKILKIHNPWLRETRLDNLAKKEYLLEIPLSGY
jgi:membrane-bound lytic murein transglycosylase D